MNRGTKRIVVVLGALGAAALGAPKAVHAWRDRAAEVERASLRRCLLGAELAPGELASGRVERVFLGTVGLSPGELEAAHATDWPGRCGVYADRIAGWQLERNDGYASNESRSLATALRSSDIARALRNVHDSRIDSAWAMMPSSRTAPTDVPIAPAPLVVPDDRTPVFAPRLKLFRLEEDQLPSRDLRLLFRRESERPLLCRFASDLRSARCSDVPEDAGQSPVLSPHTEDGGPDLVSDPGSTRGSGLPSWTRFFRVSDGQAFGTGTVGVQGSGRSGDSVLVLQPSPELPRKLSLERWRGKARVDSTPVPLPAGVEWHEPGFVGDRLAYWSPPKDGHRRLVLRHAAVEGAALGPEEDALSLPEGDVVLAACRTDGALVLDASQGTSHTLTFRDAQGGSTPVKLERAKGTRLSCEHDSAALISIATESSRHTVLDARCTRSACRTTAIDVEDFARGDLSPPPDRGPQAFDASVAAAPIGDALLVVWNSAKGGVRMRVAPPEKIAAAKDVVLFDDWLKEGRAYFASAVHSVRVVARRDAAIVLLEGSKGVWAFRVDADGKVEPLVAQ